MNTNYRVEAIAFLLNEDCILQRFHPLIPYKNQLIMQLKSMGCQSKADCQALPDASLASAGLSAPALIPLFRAFLGLYDPKPAKCREIDSFSIPEEDKAILRELYHLPGVKKTRAMLYKQAGFPSLISIARSSAQEIIAKTESLIKRDHLPCKAPLMKEAKTHIAVARAFTEL